MSGCGCGTEESDRLERRTLQVLLAINATMFAVEGLAGILAESTGLLADALDMLADAAVYGIALAAVGAASAKKVTAARLSGFLQIALGIGVLLEVVRCAAFGSEPTSVAMIVVGAVAFIANVVCLMLVAKHRHGEVHMRASWIFSANDVIANLGVVLSGVLVVLLDHRFPDLVIGTAIALLVTTGGVRILREANASAAAA